MDKVKAMKGMKRRGLMSQSSAYSLAAKKTGLKSKDVRSAVEGIMEVAVTELKEKGAFKLAGMLTLKLKKKPFTPARKGVNPFTKEPCVFKAQPASQTVRVIATKKIKEALN